MTGEAMEFSTKEFASWCFDNDVRLGTIISLGACHDGNECTQVMADLIDSHTDDELGRIFSAPDLAKWMKPFEAENEERYEYILQFLLDRRIYGFLVTVEIAVREYYDGGGRYSSSWGYFSIDQMYTEALDSFFCGALRHLIGKFRVKEKKKQLGSKPRTAAKGSR
jgi:hypothetical protein